MQNELDYYLKQLTNPFGPLHTSVLFIIIFVLSIYLIYLKAFIPVKKRHLEEKKKLELDNLKVIAAFTESDPNPVIRLNAYGDIIQFNSSAQKQFDLSEEKKTNLNQISPELSYNVRQEIDNESNIENDITIGDKHFTVYFYGLKNLSMARVSFIDHTERINNEKRIIESEDKYRSLSMYLQDHLEEEKERIGMELHDSIGQNLYLVKLKINNSADLDSSTSSVKEINEALDMTISELREIMFNLRPKVLEELGLVEAVRVLSASISDTFKIEGMFDSIGTPVRLGKKIELYLFRIIQEALSNILRHSKATEYYLGFVFSKDLLKIHISDNGIGFNTDAISKNKHYGLLNMSERVKTINGKMKISSSDDEGTSLLFEISYGGK